MHYQAIKRFLLSFVFLLGSNIGGADGVCPLYFPSQNLCASLHWLKGPSADEESAFELKFWNKEEGSSEGPYEDPLGTLGSFSRMTCCGSISFLPLTRMAPGHYQAQQIIFVPGTFEVFIQIKNEGLTEQQGVRVEIDD